MLNQPPLEPGDYVLAGTGTRRVAMASISEVQEIRSAIIARIGVLQALNGRKLKIMSGMAEGFDELLARVAIWMKIPLFCAVPNQNYGLYYWGKHSVTGEKRFGEFCDILSQAAHVTYVMEDVHKISGIYHNGKHSNYWRNDFMVEKGNDFVVQGGLNGDPRMTPGTRDCVKAIKKAGKWRADMVIGGPTL